MTTNTSKLLHEIADPALDADTRALLRCRLARELEDAGNIEAARESLGELWPEDGSRPVTKGLTGGTAAQVTLSVGVVTGLLAHAAAGRGEPTSERAKSLIRESLRMFDELGVAEKSAEAQSELARCLWRDGQPAAARSLLREALHTLAGRGDGASEIRAVALLRAAQVERADDRLVDALLLHAEAASLFDALHNHSLRAQFHEEYARALRRLGVSEHHDDYTERALAEFECAGRHFEQARLARRQARVELDLGLLLCSVGRCAEAHQRLDRAQALCTTVKDQAHAAQVDEARARVLLAERRVVAAEKLARAAVQTLERGHRRGTLARAMTTHAVTLARLGNNAAAYLTLRQAAAVAEGAGDAESAGLAYLTVIEELAEYLAANDLADTFDRASDLLDGPGDREHRDRLFAAARRVLFLVGIFPTPPNWEGYDFNKAVNRYEAGVITRALNEAGGVAARAASLLGLSRQSLDSMIRRGRHAALLPLRTPAKPRHQSLMFRGKEDSPEPQPVRVLHVAADRTSAGTLGTALTEEHWSVETCTDGATALLMLEGTERFDVLIYDDLPGVADAAELVRQTRTLAHRRRTPIITLSALDAPAAARRAGAVACLRTPEDVPTIAETIARLLARKQEKQ